MHGNVFQLHSERRKKGQFQDTLNALKTLVATEFQTEIRYLEPLFRELADPKIPLPIKPEKETMIDPEDEAKTIVRTDPVKEDIYKAQVQAYVKKEGKLEQTKAALVNIVMAQCSKPMKNKLKGVKGFDDKEIDGDIAGVLKVIRDVSNQIEDSTSSYETIDELHRQFFLYRQMPGEDNSTHLTKFKELVDVLEHNGSSIFYDDALEQQEIKDALARGEDIDKEICRELAREKHLAVCFLRRANQIIYAPLMRELRDQRLHGIDLYPITLADAYTLLENHSSSKRRTYQQGDQNRHREGNIIQGIQHAQQGERGKASGPPIAGVDGRFIRSKQYYNCYRYGHYSDNCPNNNVQEGQQYHIQGSVVEEEFDSDDDNSIVISYTYMADKRTMRNEVDRHSILIDTGSNCSVFNNIGMLTGVCKSKQHLRAMTNGGSQESEYKSMLPGFFKVWYNPNSMLNILSFGEVASKFRVTMDTALENTIKVHMTEPKGAILKFRETGAGLYLLETNNDDLYTHYSYLQLTRTPNINKQYYSRREIGKAEEARKLYEHVNVTGYGNFIKLLEQNYFRNCPITPDDARWAMELFGRSEEDVQGRSTRQRPAPIPERQIISIPDGIKERHQSISISVDYLFIQGIPILHSISGRSYQFRTLEPVYKNKANKEDIVRGLQNIINTYQARGISISQINCDNEFACVGTELLPARLNVMAADEHVGDIERGIRYIKDGTRTQFNILPYTHYPKTMVAGCMMYVLKHVNHLPSRSGLSNDLSPATLVTGDPTPSYQDITKLKFGDYVHTAYGKTTNDQTARTVGAIALYPSGNTSGGWFFMSILSGKVLHRYSWTKMEITEDTIQRITQMAISEGRGLIGENFKYAYTKNGDDIEFELIGDEEDHIYDEDLPLATMSTEDANLLAEHAHDENRDASEDIDNNGEQRDREEGAEITERTQRVDDLDREVMERHNDEMEDSEIDSETIASEQEDKSQSDTSTIENEERNEQLNENQEKEHEDERSMASRTIASGMELRPRTRINYKAFHTKGARQLAQKVKRTKKKIKKRYKIKIKDMFRKVMKITMSHIKAAAKHDQVSVEEGIRRFGNKEIEAVLKAENKGDILPKSSQRRRRCIWKAYCYLCFLMPLRVGT